MTAKREGTVILSELPEELAGAVRAELEALGLRDRVRLDAREQPGEHDVVVVSRADADGFVVGRLVTGEHAPDAAALGRAIAAAVRERDLERELEPTRERLRSHEHLLRKAMIERGKRLMAEMEERHARAVAHAAAAVEDASTGLLAHGPLRERLDFEVERSRRTTEPLGLVLLDLDGFGAYNHAHGWGAGERALRAIGRSLGAPWLSVPSRRPPALGRLEGDCFGVILPDAGREEVAARAEELRNLVERLPLPGARLTVSVGAVAATSQACEKGADLIDRARRALRTARSEGGNRVVLDDAEG